MPSHDKLSYLFDFQNDKVYSYFNQNLEEGYPKQIQEDFPGVPTHLDAAVECPKGECVTDSVLFFKGLLTMKAKVNLPQKTADQIKWDVSSYRT